LNQPSKQSNSDWKFHNLAHSTRKELLYLKIVRFDFENENKRSRNTSSQSVKINFKMTRLPGANKIATRTFGFLDLPRALNEAGYVRAGNPGADILQ
jgi:hypothetical protein